MTIKDIAKSCGVSISTVSRVLNNKPDVSEPVRRKVLDMVRNKGYIPNNCARDLVKSSSDSIGVIVRGTGNLFFSDMLKTISSEIEAGGCTMVPHFIDSHSDEVKAGAVLEREKKLMGIIFLGGRYDYSPSELSVVDVPYVCCSYDNCFGSLDADSFSSVSIDDFATAYSAVTRLIHMGHRRIAVLAPSVCDRSVSELRCSGYRAALKDGGLEFDPELVAETDGSYDMQAAFESMCSLIRSGKDFSAVFAISDTTAIAAIKALEKFGRKVPEDCSVIAIDGLRVSEYMIPTLSTMVQPSEQMGRESVHILLDILQGRGTNRHLRLEARLREGASVKKIDFPAQA